MLFFYFSFIVPYVFTSHHNVIHLRSSKFEEISEKHEKWGRVNQFSGIFEDVTGVILEFWGQSFRVGF